MEISKENVFKTQYISGLRETKQKNWTSKILKFIKDNKILSITAIVFLTCVSLNMFLIVSFMKIIEKI